MKQLIIFITLFAVLTTVTTKSAEIIPVWNRTIEGQVSDMDFLKGQDEILLLIEGLNGQIQRRNPENGGLIHFFPIALSDDISKLAFTPDSNRFVLINGSGGELRNIDEDFSVETTFLIQNPEDSIIKYFNLIAIDPIRPNAYVTTYGWNKNTNNYAPRGKVIAYNYETGEHIRDLTPYGEYEYTAIEVSHDGRYLATLNDNKAYLKVWDLETMEQIINEPLFDEDSDDWCYAQDIYFSKLNPDLIYYSGFFTKSVNGDRLSGIFSFNMESKEKKRFVKDGIYGATNLLLIDNETRIVNSGTGIFSVLNLTQNKFEYYDDPQTIQKSQILLHNKDKFFIGMGGNQISRFIYDGITDVNQNNIEEIIISPNPTGSFVNINLNCSEPQINYQINDVNGLLLFQDNVPNQVGNSLQIDFTPYPSGVYFITLNCNQIPKTYKIIKEG